MYLSWLLQHEKLSPPFEDAIRIGLGLRGDERQTDELIRIVTTHPEEQYRDLAAAALGDIGAVKAMEVLERIAKKDQFSRPSRGAMSASGRQLGNGAVFYPVRDSAANTLRILRSPDDLARNRTRADAFAANVAQRQQKGLSFTPAPWVLEVISGGSDAPSLHTSQTSVAK
jgi:hypothetical protein